MPLFHVTLTLPCLFSQLEKTPPISAALAVDAEAAVLAHELWAPSLFPLGGSGWGLVRLVGLVGLVALADLAEVAEGWCGMLLPATARPPPSPKLVVWILLRFA